MNITLQPIPNCPTFRLKCVERIKPHGMAYLSPHNSLLQDSLGPVVMVALLWSLFSLVTDLLQANRLPHFHGSSLSFFFFACIFLLLLFFCTFSLVANVEPFFSRVRVCLIYLKECDTNFV